MFALGSVPVVAPLPTESCIFPTRCVFQRISSARIPIHKTRFRGTVIALSQMPFEFVWARHPRAGRPSSL
jgi:hypothetical protein